MSKFRPILSLFVGSLGMSATVAISSAALWETAFQTQENSLLFRCNKLWTSLRHKIVCCEGKLWNFGKNTHGNACSRPKHPMTRPGHEASKLRWKEGLKKI